jgi:hypothetical protein
VRRAGAFAFAGRLHRRHASRKLPGSASTRHG